MSPPTVLCVGRVYCDLIFSGLQTPPTPGLEIYADGLSLHTGGGAAITAAHLAHIQQSVELCANLPAAPFFHIIQDEIGKHVGLQFCDIHAKDDPQITAVLTGKMDRSFVTRRVGKALPDNYAQNLASNQALAAKIHHMHIGELATLIEHPDLIDIARSADWSISLDCSWDVDAMQHSDAQKLIEGVDIFMPNEAEFALLDEAGISASSAPLSVVKSGTAGAIAIRNGERFKSPAELIQCVDSTGAGDAFNAGFIIAWLNNHSIDECLKAGNRQGAFAVSQLGGIPPL